MNSQRRLMLALVLSLTACNRESLASSSSEAASAMRADSGSVAKSVTMASPTSRLDDTSGVELRMTRAR